MNRQPCLLCGIKGIRQPVIQTRITTAYLVPLDQGGAKAARNMFTACKFHKKLYTSWATGEEKDIANAVIQAHMKRVYPNWDIQQCYEEEA